MTGTALAPGSAAPAAPPIPDDLDAVLRRIRFPYLRKAAPGVLATARAQRWDPAEVVRILLEEEIRGRDEAGRRNRRKTAGLPAGKTFASWREHDSSIPLPAQHALMTLEWVTRAENLCVAGPSGTGKSHFAEALAHKAVDAGMRVAWFTLESLTAVIGRAAVDGTTPGPSPRSPGATSSRSMTSACCPPGRPPPKPSTGWPMPPTSAGR